MRGMLSLLSLTCALLLPAAWTDGQTLEGRTLKGAVSEVEHVLRVEEPKGGEVLSREVLESRLEGSVFVEEDSNPAGLLERRQLGSLMDLASRLTADPSWLTREVLESLDRQSLGLDELFSEAPKLVRVGEGAYRIKIERVGDLWKGFDAAADPFLIYFSHEIYDEIGEDQALAFQNGGETVMVEGDLKVLPALALTLEANPSTTADLRSIQQASAQALAAPISLGNFRLAVDRGPGLSLHTASVGTGLSVLSAGDSTCQAEIAPACFSGVMGCNAKGYTPYFVLSGVLIKLDHEGWPRGAPEIELFPVRLDSTSPAGGGQAPTDFLFKGMFVSDLAGRSRYLPDVNNENVWYNVSGGGLALFPMDMGNEWGSMLVEDDDQPGVLVMDGNQVNLTTLYNGANQIIQEYRQMQYFQLIRSIYRFILDIIGFFSSDDDLFQPTLGISTNLFCTDGDGQPFPHVFTLNSSEWNLRGYFACVNPVCTGGTGGGGGGGGGCLAQGPVGSESQLCDPNDP